MLYDRRRRHDGTCAVTRALRTPSVCVRHHQMRTRSILFGGATYRCRQCAVTSFVVVAAAPCARHTHTHILSTNTMHNRQRRVLCGRLQQACRMFQSKHTTRVRQSLCRCGTFIKSFAHICQLAVGADIACYVASVKIAHFRTDRMPPHVSVVFRVFRACAHAVGIICPSRRRRPTARTMIAVELELDFDFELAGEYIANYIHTYTFGHSARISYIAINSHNNVSSASRRKGAYCIIYGSPWSYVNKWRKKTLKTHKYL